MEIIGDDKRLRALYSEARVANQTATPGFASVWHRARERSLRPRRVFNISFALVTALLVLTIGSLAVWSMYSTRGTGNDAASTGSNPGNVAPKVNSTPEQQIAPQLNVQIERTPVTSPVHQPVRTRVRRPNASADRQLLAAAQKAKETTIDSWQSPTATLLSSPTDELFKSVPQLNENANEMKSFLPGRSNDKER